MTTEQFATNLRKLAAAVSEQEVRNIMAFTGCNRERAEKLRVWLHDDEIAIGGLHRVEREGLKLGERLAESFNAIATTLKGAYRT